MAEPNNFDVMKAMAQQSKDIRIAPIGNIISARKVKAGTQITIGFGADVVGGLATGQYVGGLILCDKDQFDETKAALRKATEGEA